MLLSLAAFLGVWILCMHPLLFPETWASSSSSGRYGVARAFSYPVALLAPWPIVRLVRLVFSSWAIRVDGDRVHSQASAWRDFSFHLSEIRGLSIQTVTLRHNWVQQFMKPRSSTRVELTDGRRHNFFDHFVALPEGDNLIIYFLLDAQAKVIPPPPPKIVTPGVERRPSGLLIARKKLPRRWR